MTRKERRELAAQRRAEWEWELHRVISEAVLTGKLGMLDALRKGEAHVAAMIAKQPQLKSELLAVAGAYMVKLLKELKA